MDCETLSEAKDTPAVERDDDLVGPRLSLPKRQRVSKAVLAINETTDSVKI